MNNRMPTITDFLNFARNQQPQNAQKQVEELLRTGKMTNQEFQQLQQQASQFQRMFGIK